MQGINVKVHLHVKVAIVDERQVAIQKVLNVVSLGLHEIGDHTVVHVATLAAEAQVTHMDGLPCCLKLHVDGIVVLLWRKFAYAGVIEIWAPNSCSDC